jgi:hypothetical protein
MFWLLGADKINYTTETVSCLQLKENSGKIQSCLFVYKTEQNLYVFFSFKYSVPKWGETTCSHPQLSDHYRVHCAPQLCPSKGPALNATARTID